MQPFTSSLLHFHVNNLRNPVDWEMLHSFTCFGFDENLNTQLVFLLTMSGSEIVPLHMIP